ncbi:MAG: hypothetical protein O2886_05725 [Actinomycetota bacterium]|nr:hypothetical protein [Actinomycetota bacterium]
MNQVKNRLQSLGLLDRTFAVATDEELTSLIDSLDEEHLDALADLIEADDTVDIAAVRSALASGRLDGTMEVLTDACLADCIEQLGDNADHPSSEDLREVLPGLIERHGLAANRIMLASTVAGEAPAAAIIRDLLKNDELVALPPAESKSVIPAPPSGDERDEAEREALRERRREAKARKQAEAKARREQAARAKRR